MISQIFAWYILKVSSIYKFFTIFFFFEHVPIPLNTFIIELWPYLTDFITYQIFLTIIDQKKKIIILFSLNL